jgi:hypothetical protein
MRARHTVGMPTAFVLALLGLLVTLVAWVRDREPVPPAAREPPFAGLPSPADLARLELPSAAFGYDPAAVELTLDVVRRAYAELWTAAGEAARWRAARTLAADASAVPPSPLPAGGGHLAVAALDSTLTTADAEPELDEALRAEAALAALEGRGAPDGEREASR